MSWREVEVLEAARSVTAQGPLSRGDRLLGFAQVLLHEAVADPSLIQPCAQAGRTSARRPGI